jgi:predicted dehydrogenase
LLLLPRAGQGAAFAYELSLIRDESNVTVFPVLPLREHPLVERVRTLVANGSLGEQLHAQFHREVHRSTSAGQALVLSPRDLDEHFLGDVDLLRALAGDFAQLHAVRSGLSSEGITLANVTLAGGKRMEAAWSCVPTTGPGQWTLTLRGARGTAQLSGDDEGLRVALQIQIEDQPEVREEQTFDPSPRVLERFLATVQGEPTSPGWIDGLRAFELLATAHHSLERRRAIDLHFDPPSERSTFKTQMTAVGCCLLMLTLFGMVFLLLIGAVARELGLPPIVMRIGVFLVFAPLGVFLLLQMLLVLAKPSSSSGRTT